MTFDIAIIGAGIVGAACAYRLAMDGLSVAVIEEIAVGSGTTAAGMGHIVVMDDSEAQFSLTSYSQKLWADLADELPPNNEFERCGTIWVATDEEEMLEVRQKKAFYKERGISAEILDEKALKEAETNLREGLAGGLYVPGDSVVYQPNATAFFSEKAKAHSAKLFIGKRAVEITADGVRLSDSTLITAKKVVVAAGIWSRDLLKGLKLRKKKGHLVITERYNDFVRHQLVELGYLKSAHKSEADSVAFNIQPRITQQLLIGSSRQFDSDTTEIDYDIVRKMMDRAFEFIPGLKQLSAVRVWTGFRPATPDNLPYIGRHPAFENVFLATGHEGLGITTSLGTAELLSDEILRRESKIDRRPFSPARFEGQSFEI